MSDSGFLILGVAFVAAVGWLMLKDYRAGVTGLEGFQVERSRAPMRYWTVLILLSSLVATVVICMLVTIAGLTR